jgi:hypothetical protein
MELQFGKRVLPSCHTSCPCLFCDPSHSSPGDFLTQHAQCLLYFLLKIFLCKKTQRLDNILSRTWAIVSLTGASSWYFELVPYHTELPCAYGSAHITNDSSR